MATPEGADFLSRISEKRLKKIRRLFSKVFQPERELSAMCTGAWLLEHYRYFNERDQILVHEIKRVLERRAIPLTAAELAMLGELGLRAVAEEIKKLPMSEAIRRLREHLDINEELLAGMLNTTVAVVKEFEAGKRARGKRELEVIMELLRKTIHKLPELELAFSMALARASQPGKDEMLRRSNAETDDEGQTSS